MPFQRPGGRAGSNSLHLLLVFGTVSDVVGTRFGKNMVIQAKNYSGSVGNAAVQQAISAKAFYSCDEAMVVTNSYYTKSAKELASTAGVRLIDRDGLQSYLDDYNQKLIEVFQAEEESA